MNRTGTLLDLNVQVAVLTDGSNELTVPHDLCHDDSYHVV